MTSNLRNLGLAVGLGGPWFAALFWAALQFEHGKPLDMVGACAVILICLWGALSWLALRAEIDRLRAALGRDRFAPYLHPEASEAPLQD